VGSVAAGALLAAGGPVAGAVLTGLAAWALPVLRAVFRDPLPSARSRSPVLDALPQRWAATVEDARRALKSYERAVARCSKGPLRDRLEALEAEFTSSVERCVELAWWGAEAEAARREMDPVAVERAARSAGSHARSAAADQREVMARLDAVSAEAKARLVVINGRLDEAVGRAVEIAGKVDAEDPAGVDLAAGEVATKLRWLRAALAEADALRPDGARGAASERQRGATSVD